jgi:uncharacterized protein Veg
LERNQLINDQIK